MASNRYSPEDSSLSGEHNANGGFVMDEEDSDAKDVEIVDLHGKLAKSLKSNVRKLKLHAFFVVVGSCFCYQEVAMIINRLSNPSFST